MDDTTPEAELDDVFSIVANDTRFEILRTLWDAHTGNPEEIDGPERDPVPFSTLREDVGVQDSGRFNYHLHELVPQFVQKRADGYVLTHAGARIIGAAVSGVYTETETQLDATAMGACTESECAGTLEASYENGHVTIECDACDVQTIMHAPPILVEAHDLETNADIIQQYTLTEIQKTVRGFCPLCSGPVEVRVSQSALDGESNERVRITHECQECSSISHTTAAVFVLDHPAVVSLLHDAGVDYRTIALWKQPEDVAYDEHIQSTDPVRVSVSLTASGQRLTVVLDETLDVLEYRRREA